MSISHKHMLKIVREKLDASTESKNKTGFVGTETTVNPDDSLTWNQYAAYSTEDAMYFITSANGEAKRVDRLSAEAIATRLDPFKNKISCRIGHTLAQVDCDYAHKFFVNRVLKNLDELDEENATGHVITLSTIDEEGKQENFYTAIYDSSSGLMQLDAELKPQPK